MKKTAIITGIHGQDGAYLAQLLLEKNYRVIGADRRRADSIPWRLKDLGIHDDVEYVYMDLLEYSNMFETIKRIKPTRLLIYFLYTEMLKSLLCLHFVIYNLMEPIFHLL